MPGIPATPLGLAISVTVTWLAILSPARALDCEQAADIAERSFGVPPGLLTAIGRVEAGRPDPSTGRTAIWPWAINVQGRGSYPATLAQAATTVDALLTQGVRSIDIGCFQVNIAWHPDAFASLGDAFDPLSNALAAGRLLASLRRSGEDWSGAVGRYHSADEALGAPYRKAVLAAWGGAETGGADPVVVRVSPQARGVRVFYGAIPMPAALRVGLGRD